MRSENNSRTENCETIVCTPEIMRACTTKWMMEYRVPAHTFNYHPNDARRMLDL